MIHAKQVEHALQKVRKRVRMRSRMSLLVLLVVIFQLLTSTAVLIFGGSNPRRLFLAALLFGFIDALGLRVQSFNISSNLTSLAPYLATVVMMVWVVWRKERKQRRQVKHNR